ncbi:MAG TPA: hypothetical protein VIG77_14595, partial [Ktedonobacterales bacterium]
MDTPFDPHAPVSPQGTDGEETLESPASSAEAAPDPAPVIEEAATTTASDDATQFDGSAPQMSAADTSLGAYGADGADDAAAAFFAPPAVAEAPDTSASVTPAYVPAPTDDEPADGAATPEDVAPAYATPTYQPAPALDEAPADEPAPTYAPAVEEPMLAAADETSASEIAAPTDESPAYTADTSGEAASETPAAGEPNAALDSGAATAAFDATDAAAPEYVASTAYDATSAYEPVAQAYT